MELSSNHSQGIYTLIVLCPGQSKTMNSKIQCSLTMPACRGFILNHPDGIG